MKIIYIYTLTDPETSFIRYVGKTTNPKRRLSAHLNRCKTKKYHSALWVKKLILKGLKPILDVIEECDEDNWKDREKYWISYYRELYDLTNILDGGEGGATFGRLGSKWSDSQRENNRKARKGVSINHTPEGKLNRAKGVRRYCDKNKKPILQYDLELNFLKEWESAVDAAKELGVNHANITKVCKELGNTCGGFIWCFAENLPMKKCKKVLFNRKLILQLDKKTNRVINEFETITVASNTLGIARTSIINNLKKRSKSAGGFRWIYKL